MSQNSFSSGNSLSNQQILLVNILNRMYNDNLRQINNLNESNREIRNLLIDLLNNSNRGRQNNNSNRRQQTQRETSNGYYNEYRPSYIIDSIQEYRLPLLTTNLSQINRQMNRQNTRNNINNSNNSNNYNRTNNIFDTLIQRFFDPVPVYPTQTQIETATRRVRYCDIVTPRNTSCPISLISFNDNDMVTVIRYCGHIFNTDEITTWFRSNCLCPVCRYDIRNYNSNVSNSEIFNNERLNVSYDNIEEQNGNENLSQESSVERNTNTNDLLNNLIGTNINTSNIDYTLVQQLFSQNDLSGNQIEPTDILNLLNLLQRHN